MKNGVFPPVVDKSRQLVHTHENCKPKECKDVILSHIFPATGSLTQNLRRIQVRLLHHQIHQGSSKEELECLQNGCWNGDGRTYGCCKWLGRALPGRTFGILFVEPRLRSRLESNAKISFPCCLCLHINRNVYPNSQIFICTWNFPVFP